MPLTVRYNFRKTRQSHPTLEGAIRKALPHLGLLLLGVLLLSLLPALPARDKAEGPTALFNGRDLTGFYTYLRGHGKNKDPEGVITAHDGMIRVSGKIFGCFTTEKEYENYHLVMEFKWGEKTWPPREKDARDSGILLHCVGEDGAAQRSLAWNRSSAR